MQQIWEKTVNSTSHICSQALKKAFLHPLQKFTVKYPSCISEMNVNSIHINFSIYHLPLNSLFHYDDKSMLVGTDTQFILWD